MGETDNDKCHTGEWPTSHIYGQMSKEPTWTFKENMQEHWKADAVVDEKERALCEKVQSILITAMVIMTAIGSKHHNYFTSA